MCKNGTQSPSLPIVPVRGAWNLCGSSCRATGPSGGAQGSATWSPAFSGTRSKWQWMEEQQPCDVAGACCAMPRSCQEHASCAPVVLTRHVTQTASSRCTGTMFPCAHSSDDTTAAAAPSADVLSRLARLREEPDSDEGSMVDEGAPARGADWVGIGKPMQIRIRPRSETCWPDRHLRHPAVGSGTLDPP